MFLSAAARQSGRAGIKGDGALPPPLLLCNGCEWLLLSASKLFSLLGGSMWLFVGQLNTDCPQVPHGLVCFCSREHVQFS